MKKVLNTRILQKIDTYYNWTFFHADFVPLEGEIILYSTDENNNEIINLKIGNGKDTIVNLPFLSASELQSLSWNDISNKPDTFPCDSHEHKEIYYDKNYIDEQVSNLNDKDNSISNNLNSVSTSLNTLSNNVQLKSNLVTNINETSLDTQYPSAKLLYTELQKKQTKLTLDDIPTKDSNNLVKSNGIYTSLENIQKVANGKCNSYVFDTKEDLTSWLNSTTTELKQGDVFLLRQINWPDYWWEPSVNGQALTQYTDKDIIIGTKGAARILETTKVSLEDYALKSSVPDSLADLTTDSSHRVVTDAEKNTWNNKSNFSGNYNDLSNKPIVSGTLVAPLKVTGGDSATAGKIILDESNEGQITNSSTSTLFGFLNSSDLSVGSTSYNLKLRGKSSRPKYNDKDLALKSDVSSNADSVDGYHIRVVSDQSDTGLDGYITFII